ncbi:MAG: 4-hydroxybutyrate dehydrogenase [Dysgonamonadaceae bacterium]|jgi:4-hydroxybutyrate dehydrogenase|nr:4-hydroxybutyrate dehydrogenase [Dysgonamonadaceae bacterium]
MQLFKLRTKLHQFNTFGDFAKEFDLGKNDLVITNEFLFEPFIKPLNLPCHFIMQEKYGVGEPSDEMMNRILTDVNHLNYKRIIAIGGGTVIDISKLFVLKNVADVTNAFERKIPIIKDKELVVIPTTCGTGSEVTNISIAEIKSKHTKLGLADDALLADDAVLIPELLKGLPFRFYAASAIDALIHAVESYVSPKASPYSQLFSKEAIGLSLDIFKNIANKGENYRFERLGDMLIASNYAGIAFGNAGVGAVHALSYPLGGAYHVPHGEANYQFFTKVFKVYQQKNPTGSIVALNHLLAEGLNTSTDKVYENLDAILAKMLPKKPLKEYGLKNTDIDVFTENVINTQQRLLANNYTPFTKEDIRNIFKELY